MPDDAPFKPTYPQRNRNFKLKSLDQEGRIAALEAQLERVRQDMRAFTYSVSHDLRAPLRAIEGFGRILQEDYAKAIDEEGQKFLSHILNNAQIMSAQIDDLLIYHRLGERVPTLNRVPMTELISEIISATKPAEDSIEIKLPKLPTVTADPNLLRTAWEQLISNAIKFSKRAARPAIEFGAKASETEDIVWVRDNGIGFDMKYSDKLFQVFQKLQREPEFSGNGIGLALVRRVAEKHNGRTWCEALPNEGATFFFALPHPK